MTLTTGVCDTCHHTEPHTGGGIGVCLHRDCGCDGTPTDVEALWANPAALPALTYSGGTSSGASGSATSHARAEREDHDGTTGSNQYKVLGFADRAGRYGITVAELRSRFPEMHHGSCSSALTNLHENGHLDRLTEIRDRCKVYVLPDYVDGRDTEEPGRGKKVMTAPERDNVADARRMIEHQSVPLATRNTLVVLLKMIERVYQEET